jgi:hypothetical protein
MSFFTKPYLSRIVLSVALIGTTAPAYAAAPAGEANADEVMAGAKTQAAAEHKNILLSFSASWCGNCRLFDAFLADPKIRPILDKAFVFADLDTGERPDDKRHANIPGGREIMDALGGKTAGYPYLVMVDPRGEPIAAPGKPGAPRKHRLSRRCLGDRLVHGDAEEGRAFALIARDSHYPQLAYGAQQQPTLEDASCFGALTCRVARRTCSLGHAKHLHDDALRPLPIELCVEDTLPRA